MSYINENNAFARVATLCASTVAVLAMAALSAGLWPLMGVAAASYGLFGLCKGLASNDHRR